MIRKLVIGNGRSEREVLLVGNITIGRDPSCHVSEPDPLLSRRHAEIVANVHGVSVRDLDSRNGILVNGEKTREQVLLPGDVVQLGHLQLRYLEEQPRTESLGGRNMDVRRPAAPVPAPSAPAYDMDRFRPEPPVAARPIAPITPKPGPGRWRPEPTPLPGRRTTAPPPPPPTLQPLPPAPHASQAVPRGKAAFDDTVRVPRHAVLPDHLDDTRLAPLHDAPIGGAVELDATLLAPLPPARGGWAAPADPDATMLASEAADLEDTQEFDPDAHAAPGDATFAAALSHLAGLATPGQERLEPSSGAGARLVANSELAITDASPGCAELLGMPGESLVGDSLTDVFLRGVRCAYADPDRTLQMTVSRGPRGSITVNLTLDKTSGHE